MKWEELEAELLAIPGFKEAYDLRYPYEDVAAEIAAVRGRRDMTQSEFGALVGIPQSTVARLESGQQNPSVGMLKRIAKATGTELVIEFRPKPRARRAVKRRPRDGSTSAQPVQHDRVAASGRSG
jgi:transcriptional regulator with XRE-family HTH domain